MSRSYLRPTVLITVIAVIFSWRSGTAVMSPADGSACGAADAAAAAPSTSPDGISDKAVFFASDGLRQDLVKKYADAGADADDARRSSATASGPRRTAS